MTSLRLQSRKADGYTPAGLQHQTYYKEYLDEAEKDIKTHRATHDMGLDKPLAPLSRFYRTRAEFRAVCPPSFYLQDLRNSRSAASVPS